MLTNLPPVSPSIPFVYILDDPETAVDDLQDFNTSHIAFIIIGNPKNKDVMIRVINAFCSEPTSDFRLRALWIQEGEILEAVRPSLEDLFEDAYDDLDFNKVQSYTSVAGSLQPLNYLTKEPGSFSASNIKKEMNKAVLSSPPPSTEIN